MTGNVIKVSLWGHDVGRVVWDEHAKRAFFTFSPAFPTLGLDIAPLTASIHNPLLASGGVYGGNKEKLYQGLPEFLADSLPDSWGKKLMAKWQAEHLPFAKLTPVDALGFMGKRAMGAFEFEPAFNEWDAAEAIDLDHLYQLADSLFNERKNVCLDKNDVNLQKLYMVGTSAGGKQPKAVIAVNRVTGEIKSGQVICGEQYEHYILKFDRGEQFPFTRMEKAYYDMALACDIEMMPSKLIEIDGRPHFLTQRFDRVEGEKIHTQTLAAIAPNVSSYEELMMVGRKLGISDAERTELYRRVAFNVLFANMDDHNKNFSFLMEKDGKWRLAPAYDLNFAVDLTGVNWFNSHELSLGGKQKDITADDLIRFGQRNDIKNAAAIVDKEISVAKDFENFARENGVEEPIANAVGKYLLKQIGMGDIASTQSNADNVSDIDIHVVRVKRNVYGIYAVLDGQRTKTITMSYADTYAYRANAVTLPQLAEKYLLGEITSINMERLSQDEDNEMNNELHR